MTDTVARNCRFDGLPLSHTFVDLGFCPPSNSYLKPSDLNDPEVYYPLKLYVSERTFLVQVDEFKKAEEIFSDDYAYFSSYSTSWLDHARAYVEKMTERFGLDGNSKVVELASNDGYLLQYFVERGVPVLGVEPSKSVAAAARAKHVETITEFFGVELAEKLKSVGVSADLLVANNVLAHVPDLNDFVGGMKVLLADAGVITIEFPHLMNLVERVEFDTIYHEHFSYFSFYTVKLVLEAHGLEVFDVEELRTHGGSLRVYAQHAGGPQTCDDHVAKLLATEQRKGMRELSYYQGFQEKVDAIKFALLRFLIDQREAGKRVVAYGAAAKGNTLLNYCGVRSDLVEFVVDASLYKQGRLMPGSHIPIVDEARLKEVKPAFILILPWNLRDEISAQLAYAMDWGAKFVTVIPEITIF
ncbi:MAG: methyltransferase domain-containing protein [Opitutaceae bacterium]